MARLHPAVTHSLSALIAAILAVVVTFYFVVEKYGKTRQPPSQEAVREAHDRLSKSFIIRVSDVKLPTTDGEAVERLRSMVLPREVISLNSSTDTLNAHARCIE